jgi:HEAT repeat protein
VSNPVVWRDLAIAGHEGDEATARQGVAGPDPVARQIALGALERMGALTDGDVDVALGDIDPAVRRRAAMLAAKRPATDLMPALYDTDATVVEAAAWAAGEQVQIREISGETVGEPVLERLIALAGTAPDPQVREAAVASLGSIGDPRGLPAILAACKDKPAVKRRAVLALAPFEGPEVDAALAEALADRDWQVRQAVEDLLPSAERPHDL